MDESKQQSSWLTRTWALIGGFGVLLGIVLGVPALIEMMRTPESEVELVPRGARIEVAKNGGLVEALADQGVIGSQGVYRLGSLRVRSGVVLHFPSDALLVANELEMQGGASIRGAKISLVVSRMSGGTLVATRADENSTNGGRGESGIGESGGEVLLATARAENVRIEAVGGGGERGGDGLPGASGPSGAGGIDGDCAGFGGYRGAQPGRDGGRGQNGGNGKNGAPGGDGGRVVVIRSPGAKMPSVDISGGVGGEGGRGAPGGQGGSGGRGGRGCTGLGGSQPNQADGQPGEPGLHGADGTRGEDGQRGTIDVFEVSIHKFSEVARDQKLSASELRAALMGIVSR
jgi:hypothetical protein